jgi:hypothetical protein
VVINVEETEKEKVERKEMAARSEMWQHFIRIKDDKGFLKAARCKYCHREIKAGTREHGTFALKKHFGICKRNPHVFNKDPKQGTLQACHGEAPATWRFDQEALRDALKMSSPFVLVRSMALGNLCPKHVLVSKFHLEELAHGILYIITLKRKPNSRSSSKILVRECA